MAKPPVGKPKTNPYIDLLQQQVSADVDAVRFGAVDEELLRARMLSALKNPTGETTKLILWLTALHIGIIDDLGVLVEDRNGGPVFEFIPTVKPENPAKAAILRLPLPGPQERRAASSPSEGPVELLPSATGGRAA
jgi:hypothetical protein